nr:hypothetical protein GCM10020092_097350 [Actinoplanes digitatis]
MTITYQQGETLGIGVSECKRLTVAVQPGTAFGPKSIDTYLWDQNRPWGAEFNAQDTDDINDNKNTGENVMKVSTPVTIASLGAVAAVKGVRGSQDTTYMKYPQVGHSRPDQATSYSLDLVNTGTVALTDGVAYDVLPRPDDGRGSTFRLDLTAPPTVQAGMTVAYSTAANPCLGRSWASAPTPAATTTGPRPLPTSPRSPRCGSPPTPVSRSSPAGGSARPGRCTSRRACPPRTPRTTP